MAYYRRRYRKKVTKPYMVQVDLKRLNDVDAVKSVINNADSTIANIDLEGLVGDPKTFAAVLSYNVEQWANTNMLPKILKLYNNGMRTPELDKIVNKGICSFLDNIKSKNKSYNLGKQIPNILKECSEYFDKDTKAKALSVIVDRHDKFYSYAKKILANTAVDFAESDKELLLVLNTFYKVMDKDTFFNVINKIPNGINNPDIQKVMSKTKRFNVCKYTKAEVKNDDKKRAELLKDIARAPSSAKNLSFIVSFTLKDLEELAPVMRLNFLEWYFKDRFRCTARNYNRPERYRKNIDKILANTGLDKVKLPNIPENKLTTMLFAVGIKKNDQVTNFVERYKAYQKLESGVSMTRAQAEKSFGKRLHYYW
jgi:hypothetical protein